MGDEGTGTVGQLLATVFDDIRKTVARTLAQDGPAGSARSGDRYIAGGVYWDGYGLKPLIRMVGDQANPAQVDAVADLWRTHGAAIGQSADALTKSLNTLMRYWQGAAAAQAAESVSRNANWISEVGTTATSVASSIEDASGALRSAQSTMPGAPGSSFWSGFGSAAGGAAAGAMIGGPFGAAAGAMIGGLASMFGFGDNEKKLKRQAVQTMQRYEQAAMNIDTATPGFAAPTAGVTGTDGTTTGTTGAAGTGVGTLPTGPVGPTVPSDFQSTIPSFAAGSTARWDALTGAGGGLGGGAFGGGAGGFGSADYGMGGAGLGIGGIGGLGRAGLRAGGRASGAAAMEEEGGSALLEEADERPSGTPYGPAGGRSGRRSDDDREHRRRIPFEDELFATGMKTVPAVIGLTSIDREDPES